MSELHLPAELLNWREPEWKIWINNYLNDGVAYPKFPQIGRYEDQLANMFCLFKLCNFWEKEYHLALNNILLEKLNNQNSKETDLHIARIRFSLKVLKEDLCNISFNLTR